MAIDFLGDRCCGCAACVQRCPRQCITMQEDGEGFLYPQIDMQSCIDCGICESVCPAIEPADSRMPHTLYAAKNSDEGVRLASSSGGVFTLLAEQTIARGGVVFGARFDEQWEVMHDAAYSVEELVVFRGAKYSQSRIGGSFVLVESLLKQGREVLFSGTPCQVAALNRFLGGVYDNLLTVDFICHGVPSPAVWRHYLGTIKRDYLSDAELQSVEFRDKVSGWRNYSMSFETNISTEPYHVPLNKNAYMRGFLTDLYLRPSCHQCPSKSFSSGSDITLADFWGVERLLPEFSDDRGVSLVVVHTNRGAECFSSLDCRSVEVNASALDANPSWAKSAAPHRNRNLFFDSFRCDGVEFSALVKRCVQLSLWRKVWLRIMKK